MSRIIKCGKQICLMVFVTMFLCSCGKDVPKYVATSATVEAGDGFYASDFLLEEGHKAEFADDFAEKYVKDGVAKLNKTGKQDVKLVIDGKKYTITVNVKDTVAPKGVARMVIVCQGDVLNAEDCIKDIKDETKVTCAFKNEPDLTKVGLVNEVVSLTDEGGNSVDVPVTITVVSEGNLVRDKYVIEAGESIPAIDELIVYNKTGKYITDVSVINTSLVGSYNLETEIEGTVYTTELVIEDTVAPTATVNTIAAYYGAAFPAASEFVTGIVDKGPVIVSYETDPGATVTNQSAVRIVLTDQGGNSTVYEGKCNIIADNEAPEFIAFPEKIDVEIDSTVIWKNKVSADDNSGSVEVSLDTSKVNLKKAGKYTGYFVAKDPAGNEARQAVEIQVHDLIVTEEKMNQMCEEIVKKIITADMTTEEKLYAVYKYVSTEIYYTNAGTHDDIYKQAYLALGKRKSGDCYSFCAASQVLLSYLGYETQIVRRKAEYVSASGNHFWLLVNCGTKENPKWYHHDSCPQNRAYKQPMYMMTDAQLMAYTKYRSSVSTFKYYYSFDTSLHPASATEIVVEMTIDEKYYE